MQMNFWKSSDNKSIKLNNTETKDENNQDLSQLPKSEDDTLIVSKQHNSSCAYTNLVYLNPKNRFYMNRYIQIGEYVFETDKHDNMNVSTIGLNQIQRKMLNLEESDTVKPILWNGEKNVLTYIQLEIGLAKTIRGKETINEECLNRSFKELMENRIFNIHQKICFQLPNKLTGLVLTVLNMALIERTEYGIDTKEIDIGILSQNTSIEFTVDNNVLQYITYIPTKGKPEFLKPNWKFDSLGIGGLDKEFSVIFRRAFISRCLPDNLLRELNTKHVRGILLYGPPGTGKTLIARQISIYLRALNRIVVNGPELMNKYVGQSEDNIRNCFAAAKKDWTTNGEKSNLHVIIFDEIDAICKSRGTLSGTGVNDSMVNQLLTELDGISTPNNFLVIAMTNRKDLLDPALLRPGRIEVHVEISLPDKKGRHEILEIHTKSIRESKRMDSDVDLVDIADRTRNFSGAELAALVSCSTTFALSHLIETDQILTDIERNEKFNQVII